MLRKEIYSPLAEESFLKNLGPFRRIMGDESLSGIYTASQETYEVVIVGTLKISQGYDLEENNLQRVYNSKLFL